MECPVCDDEKLVISSREGVEIDYCPQCRGVWLDRGELDKIIDRASPGGGSAAPAARPIEDGPRREHPQDRRYDDDDDRRHSGKKKKRGSFLEDLFDF